MSAIAGLVRLDGRPVEAHELQSMSAALGDHGPDRSGLWHRDSVGLAHRLMRITPEDRYDEQPLVDEVAGLVLIADVRLDNRTELAAKLSMAPSEAAALPDSAFILKSYRAWGEACVDQLLGEFAFALWDARRRKLFCARDHLGHRPFFYFRSNRCLAFASAPKGLFALPEIPARLNETKLADFLVLLFDDTQASYYEDVQRLPAAHKLIATPEGIRIERYWSLDTTRELRLKNDDEYIEAFHEVFGEAVRCQLRCAHPVGAFMSGGLDSSSVACIAAKELEARGERFPVFTSVPRKGFDGPDPRGRINDETPYVEAIRRKVENLDVHYVRAEGRTPLDGLDELFSLAEAPIRSPWNRVWMEAIQEEAASRGIRVLLSGQMGNMTISWNGQGQLYRLFRQGNWRRLGHEIHALAAANNTSDMAVFRSHVARFLVPGPLWNLYHRRRHKTGGTPWRAYSAIGAELESESDVGARFRGSDKDPAFRPSPDSRAQRAFILTQGAWTDAAELLNAWKSRFGVEIRDPTMDRRVVEFCLAIPEEQFLKDGVARRLVRRAMEGILPREVILETRKGQQTADWRERFEDARAPLTRLVARFGESKRVCRFLDVHRLQAQLEHWPVSKWENKNVTLQYRYVLLRAVTAGAFVLWLDSRGRLG